MYRDLPFGTVDASVVALAERGVELPPKVAPLNKPGVFDRTAARYFEFLETLGQKVIATDLHGSIVHWSRTAETLYGWPRGEVMGRNIIDVTPAKMSRDQAAEIMRALTAGDVWSGEFSVRGQHDASFLVSVTDVPIINDAQHVTGVIGISAPTHGPTDLHALLTQFAEAANLLWPQQLSLELRISRDMHVPASEPHVTQLLSLFLIRHYDSLDAGESVAIEAQPADPALFAEFGLPPRTPAAHLSIARQSSLPRSSLVREVLRQQAWTSYAATLVNAVGGMVVATATPDRMETTHLILPLEPVRR